MVEKCDLFLINLENITKEHPVPTLFETWNWEGEESVLPYKWSDIINKSRLNELKNTNWDIESLKKLYINSKDQLFDKTSFYFHTYRGDVGGIIYLNTNLEYLKSDFPVVEFLLVNPKYEGKGVELSLFTKVIKKAIKLGFKKLYFSEATSIINYSELIKKFID